MISNENNIIISKRKTCHRKKPYVNIDGRWVRSRPRRTFGKGTRKMFKRRVVVLES